MSLTLNEQAIVLKAVGNLRAASDYLQSALDDKVVHIDEDSLHAVHGAVLAAADELEGLEVPGFMHPDGGPDKE